MSRVGKKPITIPKGVDVQVAGSIVTVKGPKGSVVTPILAGVSVEKKDGLLNLVRGVTDGFKREIDLVGIGFKAEVKGKNVVFSVGFSHVVTFPMPDGIKVDVAPDAKAKDITHVIVTGVDKQKVGQTATEIRGIRPPDPYKLKGFRFVGEVLKKKAGKATGK